jgi:hypothetical protein
MPKSFGCNSMNFQSGIGSNGVDSQRCQSAIDTWRRFGSLRLGFRRGRTKDDCREDHLSACPDCEYCGHGWCLAFREDDAVKLKISAGKFNPQGKFLERLEKLERPSRMY